MSCGSSLGVGHKGACVPQPGTCLEFPHTELTGGARRALGEKGLPLGPASREVPRSLEQRREGTGSRWGDLTL